MGNILQYVQLAQALTPFVVDGVVTVEHVVGALKGAGSLTSEQVDSDLRSLISEALGAKMEADRAASGNDVP